MSITRKTHVIGKPFPLIEAQKKLTGKSCYAGDEQLQPDALHARILFSDRPSARFRLQGVEAARNIPGVVVLLTGQDLPATLGYRVEDRELLAQNQVRYAGQPLAIVAAESPEAAEAALQAIEIDYEDTPAVLDMAQALAPDSPLVHPQRTTYPGMDHLNGDPNTNLAHQVTFQRGDIEEGFAATDYILEHTYRASALQHAPLETHGGVAQRLPDGTLFMVLHTQAPFLQRQVIARALNLPPEKVRIISQCVGGSFGSKIHVSIEALLAALALHAQGRQVRLHLTREEEFKGVFMVPPMEARLKMGVTREGQVVALEAEYNWNVGASIDAFLAQMDAIALAGTGPYAIPHVAIHVRGIYTNLLPAAPMRGLSMAHVHWAVEQHMDELAEWLDMDPLAFRRRNVVKGGDLLFPDFIMHANGLEPCSQQAAQAVGLRPEASTSPEDTENEPGGAQRGRGLAMGWSPVIISEECASQAIIQCDSEQRCTVMVDGVDIGQGYYAFVTQVVSFELNIPVEWITVAPTDTANFPPDWIAVYHDLAWTSGKALLQASRELKHQILQRVAQLWDEPITNLDIVEGRIISYASRQDMSLLDLLARGGEDGGPISFQARGIFRPQTSQPHHLLSFTTTGYAAELDVDMETGGVKVLRLAGAADVGHAINPEAVRAHIKGGILQGISTTLLEELRFENGVPVTTDFKQYPIATTADMPQQLMAIVVEVPQMTGPYGARNLSSHVLVGASAAIGNAVYRASGVRIRELPITSQRIYDALHR